MYNIGASATRDLRGLRKGSWTETEDELLRKCIEKYGEGHWHRVPQRAGLNRCRKSCRLRWTNYLKPDIKRGQFGVDEIDLILRMHKLIGNRWSLIAGRLPGRTANDVKNYWNSHLRKTLPSSRPTKPRSRLHNLCPKTNDVDSLHASKNQPTLLHATNTTIKSNNSNKIQIFKPQPWTFRKDSSSQKRLEPRTMIGQNRPISCPKDNEQSLLSNIPDQEKDGVHASWWERVLMELKGKEDSTNPQQDQGSDQIAGTSQGSEEPRREGELDLDLWLASLNDMPRSPFRNLLQDDHSWDFDVDLWQ